MQIVVKLSQSKYYNFFSALWIKKAYDSALRPQRSCFANPNWSAKLKEYFHYFGPKNICKDQLSTYLDIASYKVQGFQEYLNFFSSGWIASFADVQYCFYVDLTPKWVGGSEKS